MQAVVYGAMMPELPEVETTCAGIAPHLVHHIVTQVIVRNPNLRWPVSSDITELVGARVHAVQRRAKYLLIQTDTGTVIMHLGMSGCLKVVSAKRAPLKHDHIDFILDSGMSIRYTDPRRFGCCLWTKEDPYIHPLLQRLGPEPLSNAFNTKYLTERLYSHKKAIKLVIMDNQIVVGVGNIYASEALFAANIHPLRPADQLSTKETSKLVRAIKKILTAAVAAGGTTLRDFFNAEGKPGYFSNKLMVYGRVGQSCYRCTETIAQQYVGQRNTFFCGSCQN